MKLRETASSLGVIFGLLITSGVSADVGNRYGLPQLYASDISAASAYLLTSGDGHEKDHRYSHHDHGKPVIIDVRRVSEHVAGHPPGAYSIPFPHVDGSADEANDSTGYIGYDLSGNPDICFVDGCDDDTNIDGTLSPADYVAYVESLFPDKDTPIMTLCKTGSRSVQVANLLTRAGYTDVRNIWEGFIGQPKYAYTGGDITEPHQKLDVNHDGVVNDLDKDGWASFQGLPVSTRISWRRIFKPYSYLYY